MMDLITSWAGSPEVRLVSETGSEVKVHRILLGLYTDQWRQNLQALASTDLVFILQGVGDQELEALANDIYRPLFDVREDEVTESDEEPGVVKDYSVRRVSVIQKVGGTQGRENDQEPDSRYEDNTNVVGEISLEGEKKYLETCTGTINIDEVTVIVLDDDDDVEEIKATQNDQDSDKDLQTIETDTSSRPDDNNDEQSVLENNGAHENLEKVNGRIDETDKNIRQTKDDCENTNQYLDIKLRPESPEKFRLKMRKTGRGKGKERHLYFCEECGYEEKKYIVKNHIESKHLGIKYPCDQCDKIKNSIIALKNHIWKNHPVTLFTCEYCEYSAGRKGEIRRHTDTVHLNIKNHECKICKKKFQDLKNLDLHIQRLHEKKRVFCKICSKFYSPPLKHHMLRRHKEKLCDHCGGHFENDDFLRKHLRENHQDKIKQFQCPSCDYKTYNKGSLSDHQLRIHNITYLYCDQCDYKSKKNSDLKTHQKQKHDSSFEYFQCDQCDYKAARKDNLITHKNSLHDNVRYPCDQCEYQATRMQYLQQHLVTKHQE